MGGSRRIFHQIVPSVLAGVIVFGAFGCAPVRVNPDFVRSDPRTRDEQVMDAVLIHFLSDHSEDLWLLREAKEEVLLHVRNPEGNGILDQTAGDIGDHKLDAGLIEDLNKRNSGQGYESAPFSFVGFRLDKRIKIVDVEAMFDKEFDRFSAVDAYKGYFEAFAPGYSQDGRRAVVRAWIGPSSHGGTATYSLTLEAGKWRVVWRYFAFYV